MTTVFHARSFGRFPEIKNSLRKKKVHKTNQGFKFFGDSASIKDNVSAPIQFRKKDGPRILKDDISS